MKLNWRKIFDWSVDCVGGPAQVFNKDGSVRGYKVIVRYVHHGSDELFFDMESEHLWTQYGGPEEAAKQVAQSYRRKMTRQRIATLARQKQ